MRTKTSAPPLAAVGIADLIKVRAYGFCDSGTESSRSRLTKSQPRLQTALRNRGLFTGIVSPERRTWRLGMVTYLLERSTLSGLSFLRISLGAGIDVSEQLAGLADSGEVDYAILQAHDRGPILLSCLESGDELTGRLPFAGRRGKAAIQGLDLMQPQAKGALEADAASTHRRAVGIIGVGQQTSCWGSPPGAQRYHTSRIRNGNQTLHQVRHEV